ncbi:MAG: peptidoglycan-binding protein, partial [Rhodocyclales bacterium]|nr:peptidoglycan-binding protein [Rhodocyclales bacterium]
GLNSVISINRGKQDGVEIGHVLALYRTRLSLNVDEDGVKTETPVPDERYGLAFVFRTFDRISYALIVRASKPVITGDNFRNP